MRFLGKQLGGLLVTMLAASFIVFAALYVAPGSPLAFLSQGRTLTPEAAAALNAQYHLDAPLLVRYWDWLVAALHGDFGTSLVFKTSVSSLLAPRMATTLSLLIYAATLTVVVGVTIGTLSALKRGVTDGSLTFLITVGLAIPSFVMATLLITAFGVELGWFPVFGSGSGLAGRLYHLTLPAVALAVAGSAFVARVTRSAVRDEEGKEHVETARSRGLPERDVVRRHILRNAIIPIATVTGLTVVSLLAGTIVVETAFGLNGIGSLLVQAVNAHDFPVVQAISLIIVAAFVVCNVAVDVITVALDPRLRSGSRA